MTEVHNIIIDDDDISDFRKIIDAKTSLLIADKFNEEKNTIKYQIQKTLEAILYSIQSASRNGKYKYEIGGAFVTNNNPICIEVMRVLNKLGYKTELIEFYQLIVTWNK